MSKTIFGLRESDIDGAAEKLGYGELDGEGRTQVFARSTWTGISEPGDRVAGLLIDCLGPTRSLELIISKTSATQIAQEIQSLQEYSGVDRQELIQEMTQALERWQPRVNSGDALLVIKHAVGIGAQLLTPEDSRWPSGLRDLGHHAPVALWFRGNQEMWSSFKQSLSIVGARASTGYGEHVTMQAVSWLSERNVAIVSGAAYGIDGMAHRTALASGGVTSAFLAGGVDRFYPSGHSSLLNRIAEQGLIISEVPCGFAPTKWRFLQRNRLIAASSQATVVIEAGWRSGSINTANHAVSLVRPLGAVPGPVTSASSAGCHRLLRESTAICVTTPQEMIELLPNSQVVNEESSALVP